MGVSNSFLDDDGVSPRERSDCPDGDPYRGKHDADDAEAEWNLEQGFSGVALDGDPACVSFADDFLDFLEEVIAGDFMLFGAL